MDPSGNRQVDLPLANLHAGSAPATDCCEMPPTVDEAHTRKRERSGATEDAVTAPSTVDTELTSFSSAVAADVELVAAVETLPESSSTAPSNPEEERGAAKRRRDVAAAESCHRSGSGGSLLPSFPPAPESYGSSPHCTDVSVEQPVRAPHAPLVVLSPSLASPVSPSSARVPSKTPRKTPVTTPGSSVNVSSPFARSPASSANASFAGHGVAPLPDAKRTARIGRWVDLLLPVLMVDRGTQEEPAVKDVCMRIASAIPGDRQEAKDTFLMLLVNLKDPKNSELRKRILDGQLPVEVLVTLGERELANPERRKELEEQFETRAKDTNLVEIRKASMTSSTLFPCPKCRARDCTWTQKQTRSADEPMTVFCTCNKCGNVWKKY